MCQKDGFVNVIRKLNRVAQNSLDTSSSMINVGCQMISATLGIFNPLHSLQQKTTNEAQIIENIF